MAHPEITAELDRKRGHIVITVVGANNRASFRTDEPASRLWSEESPCPSWAQDAVRFWAGTPAGVALYRQLAVLLGRDPDDWSEEPTANERPKGSK